MKVQVKRGFVESNKRDYFHPSLASLDGRYVDVICGLSSSRVDVYWHGKFYCEAAYVPASQSALPPMKPAEKGRIERALHGRTRRSAHYPMMGEFPAIPDNCRCRSAIRSENSLWREMRRTARSCRRLRRAKTQNNQFEKILSALLEAHVEQMAMLKKLDKCIQELRG
ncbi:MULTISPECIES: hypothetical protein [unclassified Pantoea]|uniref:hypothetical protein n=1 Tax=unclassified Pantoea TaxID=2630326 RepID=UPI0012321835|nr:MULTISPECIES: hypothetical protein [unclassified Pantoea]KAA5957780.1 hypothetical protein F3I53_16145 [Pantoea sp. VH_16]KAA6104662.1 hypothetical protein F3I25_16305 [Pantoea sp. Bo_14]KAA6108038.1 hypothetical protein F3I23_15340 [Pantoea sp. Bo_11]